ncbi:alkaline phosphatase family protein [Tundrisphaera lichenicola]|uniref:alkaline phosphatase family protein n=1 Tax=Tundrisphaera lichenicola TaxID=2029860 RepID=UPI003EBF22E2
MKIVVIGLDCAAPEILLGDEQLANIRCLMEAGCYGRLESIIPPITVPAWICMATGQDPGMLGVYGFRNRADRSYDRLQIVNSRSIDAVAMWDQVAREGGKSVVIGVPPGYPPRKVNGISIGDFLTPDTDKGDFTHPPRVAEEIRQMVGSYPVDVKGFRTSDKAWLRDQTLEMSRKQFRVVRHYLQNAEWDYFQFVEIGLDRMHHGFWSHHDPSHLKHDPNSPFKETIRDYYRHLDAEIGSILELLSDDTIVLVVSDHGARKLDGGFCINEWLVREGLLKLVRYPEKVTSFADLEVDWDGTTAWSEGGYYARVFLNVKGREPRGTIEPADYEKVRDDLKARLEATTDPEGQPLGTLVFKPEEIYREVRNVAPDLIVHLGALAWRSIGGVGYPSIHVQENDTGPDDCNHAQHGVFVLAAPGLPISGEIEGAHLLDIAPTLLELGGYDLPPSMRGRSLVAGMPRVPASGYTADGEAVIRDRLSGLGYLS